MAWYHESTFYQIYPLGLCGAPAENDGVTVPRLRKLEGWVDHLKTLGVGAVLFNPLFASDRHGYDTRDFLTVDCRLGTNEDFKALCTTLHAAGLRVMLDGVFHHVGRNFWAFQDLLKHREASPYQDWFHVDFGRNSNYGDGLWYEGWEGHYELVKLNLRNPRVVDYLLSCVSRWLEEFDIDGLRLDVAYCLDGDFLRALRRHCDGMGKSDFFLFGEVLGGDYRRLLGDGLLHSCTNYECFKGLWSSFNDRNLFEIAHSLHRLFSDESWAICRGERLVSFADNHDVTRLATVLGDKEDLPLLYATLFAMPGIPTLYYGSEWGVEGDKTQGDAALRPAFDRPQWTGLTETIARYIRVRGESAALRLGSFCNLHIQNRQLAFLRTWEGERVVFALNLDGAEGVVELGDHRGGAVDLLTGERVELLSHQTLPPRTAAFWRLE